MTQVRRRGMKSIVVARRVPRPQAGAEIRPIPGEDLVFRGGRVLPDLQYKTFYVGKSWVGQAADMKNIDDALAAAMMDPALNAIVGQYFSGHAITTTPLASS